MTTMLETALARLKELPGEQQDAIAAIIMAEIESDRQWETAYASSQDELAGLAEEAQTEYRAGKTKPLEAADEV
ncbi:hypothetical protein ACFL6X_09795 [Candidatus Latescibacterota bacterium]